MNRFGRGQLIFTKIYKNEPLVTTFNSWIKSIRNNIVSWALALGIFDINNDNDKRVFYSHVYIKPSDHTPAPQQLEWNKMSKISIGLIGGVCACVYVCALSDRCTAKSTEMKEKNSSHLRSIHHIHTHTFHIYRIKYTNVYIFCCWYHNQTVTFNINENWSKEKKKPSSIHFMYCVISFYFSFSFASLQI